MSRVSQTLDRIHATFDDDNLVANAGLLLPATVVERLGVEALINTTVRLDGRVGGAYTDQVLLDHPEITAASLRADAVLAVSRFVDQLRACGSRP